MLLLAWLGGAGAQSAAFNLCKEIKAQNRVGGFLLPGLNGWLFHSDELKSYAANVQKAAEQIAELSQVLQVRGITLVVVPLPLRPAVNDTKLNSNEAALASYNAPAERQAFSAMLSSLRSAGVLTVDVLAPIMNALNTSTRPLYFKNDQHWTPEGAALAAREVATFIQALPVAKTLPKAVYQTTTSGQIPYIGEYQSMVRETCGPTSSLPDSPALDQSMGDMITRYTTGRTEQGLLDDEATPVVLAGTSQSDARFNFTGSLSEQLGVGVLNVSVFGGGSNAALMQYFLSDAYLHDKPKIVVWEFPLNVFNPDQSPLSEIIASVYQDCSEPVFTQISALRASNSGPQTILDVPDGTTIDPRKSYLFLNVADPAVDHFQLSIDYVDGRTEKANLKHYRVQSTTFFFGFASRFTGAVKRISLLPPSASVSAITTKVCRKP